MTQWTRDFVTSKSVIQSTRLHYMKNDNSIRMCESYTLRLHEIQEFYIRLIGFQSLFKSVRVNRRSIYRVSEWSVSAVLKCRPHV
jgi:hypothetical protein